MTFELASLLPFFSFLKAWIRLMRSVSVYCVSTYRKTVIREMPTRYYVLYLQRRPIEGIIGITEEMRPDGRPIDGCLRRGKNDGVFH